MQRALRSVCGVLTLILVSAPLAAQTEGDPTNRDGVQQRFRASGLRTGEAFPDVSIYDADGKPFRTGDLKGRYTVLVTGCLT